MIVAAAITLAATRLGVGIAAIAAKPHGTEAVVLARHVAIYLCLVSLQLTTATKLAPRFGRHRSSLDDAVRLIEDRRDERGFEAWLKRIERVFREEVATLISQELMARPVIVSRSPRPRAAGLERVAA